VTVKCFRVASFFPVSTIFHSQCAVCEFTRERESFGGANLLNFNQSAAAGAAVNVNSVAE
jgi:hypothetical protein